MVDIHEFMYPRNSGFCLIHENIYETTVFCKTLVFFITYECLVVGPLYFMCVFPFLWYQNVLLYGFHLGVWPWPFLVLELLYLICVFLICNMTFLYQKYFAVIVLNQCIKNMVFFSDAVFLWAISIDWVWNFWSISVFFCFLS
jgi:hypothetical protein